MMQYQPSAGTAVVN